MCNDVVESQFSDIKIATIYRQSIIQVQWLMAPLIMVKWSSCRDLLKILNKLTLAAQQACNIAALTVRKINSPSPVSLHDLVNSGIHLTFLVSLRYTPSSLTLNHGDTLDLNYQAASWTESDPQPTYLKHSFYLYNLYTVCIFL